VPQTFRDQLAVVEELLAEVRRMEEGERSHRAAPPPDGYERELRLAGLAQRVAQAYTIMEGVMSFVARRIDRAPVAGDEWHRRLIERCAQQHARRPALLPASLARELRELSQFRHVVRNIYPTRLEEARVRENLDRLARAAPEFAARCRAFAANLPRTLSPRARARGTRRTRS
jgi:hypothetical protein